LRDEGHEIWNYSLKKSFLGGMRAIENHQVLNPLQLPLEMQLQYTTLFALVFAVVSSAHDGHHEDQIPMNYVKYPYQAKYPGDNEGMQQNVPAIDCRSPPAQSLRTPSSLELPHLRSCHGSSVLEKTVMIPSTSPSLALLLSVISLLFIPKV